MLCPDGAEGVHGVASAPPADLDVTDLRPGDAPGRQPQQLQPVGGGGSGGHLLVGRYPGGDQQQPIQAKCFDGILRRPQMADVGRIVGSAVDADAFHGNSPSFVVDS